MEKLSHLEHSEDLLISHGTEGFRTATDTLAKTHDFLSGKKPSNFTINTKWDGSPAIITGHNPEGQFFVATKSAFNKNPKINYSLEDIDKNHKDAPGLVKKLKQAFMYLEPSLPKKGVFQGDLMHTPDDVESNGSKLSFTPNTITYSVDKNTPEGKRVQNSKLGIVIHSQYKEDANGKQKVDFNVDQSKFKNTGDVNFIDPAIPTNKIKYTPEMEKQYAHNMMKAKEISKSLQQSGIYDKIQGQEPLLMTYINSAIKAKKENTLQGYLRFVESRYKKETEKIKTDTNKGKKKDQMDALIAHIMDNKDGLQEIFKLHKLVADTKNIFVHALASAESPFKPSVNGTPSKPEGFVAVNNGNPIKLVDRAEFSAANFNNNEKVAAEDNPMVFSFGRMNPPTIGHDKLVQKVMDVARRMGAEHRIVMSATQDKEKNPLDPGQKLIYAKQAFPDANIAVATKDKPGIIDQLKQLHSQGVRHLTVVAGEDRIKEYSDLINKYNGKKDFYNFRKVRVVSAGHRDEKAEGVEGMSASKVRKAAKTGDFSTFRAGMAPGMTPEATRKMYADVRTRMLELHKDREKKAKDDTEIGPTTRGIALSIYAKRNLSDRIGSKARMEINRRKREGKWSGKK